MTEFNNPSILGTPLKDHTLLTLNIRRQYVFHLVQELGQARENGTLFPKEIRHLADFLERQVTKNVPEEQRKKYISSQISREMFPSKRIPVAVTNICVNMPFFNHHQLAKIEKEFRLYLQRASGRKIHYTRKLKKKKERYVRARRVSALKTA